MITANDLETIRQAILKNVPPQEHATAIAMMNVGLHAIGTLDRIATSFERIAIAIEKERKSQ